MKKIVGLLASVFMVQTGLISAPQTFKQQLLSKVRNYRENHEHTIIKEFVELLSIPNVSSDRVNIRKNANHIRDMMQNRGVIAEVLETAGNPVVYGEIITDPNAMTLMFYVHYDGQPVDPSKWTDTHPFRPSLRPGKLLSGTDQPKPMSFPPEGEKFNEDWRIYARGSSDDRAPIICILSALDALKQANIPLKNNLKFIFEGEEEAGSTNLRPFLENHKARLKTDILFMCDGPAYYSGDPTLFFGVRGITSLEITVYGPNVSIHSGHYGNWAPNPAMRLAQLLASMKDDQGRVLAEGFYDTVLPLTESEISALKAIPPYDNQIQELYGFSGTEGGGISLLEAIQRPALNINGLESGWTGSQARTIIPPEAIASIDIRMVKGNDPEYMRQCIIRHVQKQGYHIVDKDPDQALRMKYPLIAKVSSKENGYRASRTSMDLPIARAVIGALSGYFETPPILLPSLGGSLPVYLFEDTLQVPVIGISIANHDNNQHQPDENIRIGNLWRAIETFAAVLVMGDDNHEE
jgi:acetylornithine deacetylase/succinyl-diaminopimelate desuccinylase-like protein